MGSLSIYSIVDLSLSLRRVNFVLLFLVLCLLCAGKVMADISLAELENTSGINIYDQVFVLSTEDPLGDDEVFASYREFQSRHSTADGLIESGPEGGAETWLDYHNDYQPQMFGTRFLWFSVVLNNDTDNERDLVVVISEPGIIDNETALYFSDGTEKKFSLGTKYPFSHRPIVSNEFIVPFSVSANSSVTLLIKAQGHFYIDKVAVWDYQRFLIALPQLKKYGWLFFGAAGVLILFSGILCLLIREKASIAFFLFITASAFSYFVRDGYAFQYLWPDSPWLAQRAGFMSLLLSFACSGLFARWFLDLPKNMHWLSRYCEVMVALYFGGILLGTVLDVDSATAMAIFLLVLVLPFYSALWLGSLLLAIRGLKQARDYCIAWFLYLLPLTYGAVMYLSTSAESSASFFHLRLGEGIVAVALSVAIILQLVRERGERDLIVAEGRAKGNFLAKMSHELRTPINGVFGMVQLLKDTELSKDQKHYTEVIYFSSKTLLNVINDILDYSKIEAGKMVLENIEFDLDYILVNINSLFLSQARERGLYFYSSIPPDCPFYLKGDPVRLQQVLNNLLGNAIKFTDSGYVALNLSFQRHSEDSVNLRFSVKDTGIGISPQVQKQLFKSFSQGDETTARRFGGTGLGLSISKELVALMGGHLSVTSEEGKGACFNFDIEMSVDVEHQVPWENTIPDFTGQTIAVVFPTENTYQAIAQHFVHWGMKSMLYGFEDTPAQRILDNKEIDIVLVPAAIFELWSPSVIDKMAERGLKLIALDTSASLANNKASNYPYYYGLTMPFSIRGFRNLMESVCLPESEASRPEQVGSVQERLMLDMSVLVVEDNAVNQQVMIAVLNNLGAVHAIARNGLEAVAMVAANYEDFDVILMDCEMPDMDGFEATEEIRRYEASQSLTRKPIIALTAHVLPEMIARCKAAGMDDMLTKPLDLDLLAERLNGLSLS